MYVYIWLKGHFPSVSAHQYFIVDTFSVFVKPRELFPLRKTAIYCFLYVLFIAAGYKKDESAVLLS